MKVKIREIRTAGLKGATPRGGWSTELVQEDSVHTLVVVFTDEGVTGVGGVFTNSDLVRAALAVLEPLYRDENALEPERVSETQQNGQRLNRPQFCHTGSIS